jgi:putative addiction module killer protein
MKSYEIDVYRTVDDVAPFQVWIEGLKDGKAKAKLTGRLLRAQNGNFGDWKDIKGVKGLCEFREHYGPGYRIFFTVVGQRIIPILAGSTKDEQARTIAKAAEYLADFRMRVG